MKPIIAILLSLALFAAPLHAGNCSLLYRRQAVVSYAQPVVAAYAAPVYYAVGSAIQEDAIAEKIAAKVAEKLKAMQAAPAAQGSAGSAGSLGVKAQLLTAKCARCHSGEAAKGWTDDAGDYHPVKLDGSEPISDRNFRRIVAMLGTGKGVPKAMAGLVGGLTPAEKGQLTEELLGLEAVTDAPPTPDSGELK